MLLSCDWGPTKWDTKSTSVPVSTCMQAFTVHPTGSAQHGFGTPASKAEEDVFLLKVLFCIYFCTFSMFPPHPPSSRYNENLRGNKTIQVVHFGKLLGDLMGDWIFQIGLSEPCSVLAAVASSLWMCVCFHDPTYWFFSLFLSCFLVKTNWTSHNDFFV